MPLLNFLRLCARAREPDPLDQLVGAPPAHRGRQPEQPAGEIEQLADGEVVVEFRAPQVEAYLAATERLELLARGAQASAAYGRM
jgi:hypothetical protein